jgi:NAD(P)-dependent dehydrogenase (short-subunit alcohol dehydrogenase family)
VIAPRPVVVTGGAGGLGTAIIARLLWAGRHVVAADLNVDALTQLVEQRDADHALNAYDVDVADAAQVDRLFEQVTAELGPPNGLVNLAGTNLVCPIEDISLEEWQRIITLNMTTTFLCCRAAVPRMREAGGGRIINMSSIFGLRGEHHEVAYSAAKAGIIGLTRALATEVAFAGITVNSIAPVATLTPRVAGFDRSFLDRQLAQIPMGRFGEPEDVAMTVEFLLSDAANFYTGQVFSPNGGDVMP